MKLEIQLMNFWSWISNFIGNLRTAFEAISDLLCLRDCPHQSQKRSDSSLLQLLWTKCESSKPNKQEYYSHESSQIKRLSLRDL